MAELKKIIVMISSRCNDEISYENKMQALSVVRSKLKAQLESETLLGKKIFDVWINEESEPLSGIDNSWEACMNKVKACHVLLVLSNNYAGWAKSGGEIGICHAELETAYNREPAKVYTLGLSQCKPSKKDDQKKTAEEKEAEKQRNEQFKSYCKKLNLFRDTATTGEEVIEKAKITIRQAVADMVSLGQREASKGSFHSGEALDWSRLNFQERKAAMESAVKDCIGKMMGAKTLKNGTIVKVANKDISFVAHGIPAALSVAAAKEMVGQPFLTDHKHDTSKCVGPVHVIACQKGVTELQAMKLLGFPDAVIVAAPFGVYAADNIQKIQMVFLANCRDDTTTRHAVQRFFEWLESTGEDVHLAKRAKSRSVISKAIAKELT